MIGIVIVAHGGLAREYLAALEHVVGQQSGLVSVSIGAECNRADKRAEICAAISDVDTGDGVVIVTDMYGSTPSNLAIAACEADNRAVIYGANMPVLVKLVKARGLALQNAVDMALDAGHKYLNCAAIAS
ncbi:MAG: PTS fructose transporter subunit IIA [Paracoccaceae bacterium]